MANIFIQLQTPTIELEIKSAKDPSGESGKIRVGFRRYDAFEGQKKFGEIMKTLQSSEQEDSDEVAFKKLHETVLREVEYICKAIVKVQEGTSVKELTVDTRKPPVELWSSSEEAVSDLVRMYLSSTPWRNNLLSAMFDSFSNRDMSDLAELKN